MHDGSLKTLTEVIEFYDKGGIAKRKDLSGNIHPLHLSEKEEAALLSFLSTLTSDDEVVEPPPLPSGFSPDSSLIANGLKARRRY